MTEIVAVDIGGTHARFALAQVGRGSVSLGPETVLRTSEHDGLASAWRAYAALLGRDPPRRAGIAIAAPIDGDEVRMTNNHWVVHQSTLAESLGLDAATFINDFAAVAHAVANSAGDLRHVCGPDRPLPDEGVISVIGPGTGLGVAILHRTPGATHITPTEGAHIEFAPLDEIEEALRDRLRARFGRVSVERVVCGSGLAEIAAALDPSAEQVDDKTLWARALAGADPLASEALDRFCRCLGSASGDLALAQGADAVVLAGGLGLRLADHLPRSGFAERFVAKGRYRPRMAAMAVKLITHPQPGLLGAAAAFAAEHRG